MRRYFRNRDIRKGVLKTEAEVDQVGDLNAAFDRFPFELVGMHHNTRLFLGLYDLLIKLERFWRSGGHRPLVTRFECALRHRNPHSNLLMINKQVEQRVRVVFIRAKTLKRQQTHRELEPFLSPVQGYWYLGSP